ncbi:MULTISPECIES: hypothetical protein [unclassified Streptomyces]|uniref:hypothetical protein n=1 Tax=unclassified Streptomyces TaxID=2593676 RepID=UPI0033AE23CC
MAHTATTGLDGKAAHRPGYGHRSEVEDPSLGNLAASIIAGVLWTVVSPTAAFAYLTAWMVLALGGLLALARR